MEKVTLDIQRALGRVGQGQPCDERVDPVAQWKEAGFPRVLGQQRCQALPKSGLLRVAERFRRQTSSIRWQRGASPQDDGQSDERDCDQHRKCNPSGSEAVLASNRKHCFRSPDEVCSQTKYSEKRLVLGSITGRPRQSRLNSIVRLGFWQIGRGIRQRRL